MKNISIKTITIAAIIAAIYAVLTIILAPISFGLFQFRASEALCILPVLTPAAIPGLFIGCIISNMAGGFGYLDIIFGSLATLAAAILTRKLRGNIWLAALPPVILNGVIVGAVLSYQLSSPLLLSIGQVFTGELLVLYVLGIPLNIALKSSGIEKNLR